MVKELTSCCFVFLRHLHKSAAKAITQVRYLIFITNCILPFAIATWALNRTKIHSFLSDLVCTLSCADVIFSTQYLLVF